MSDGTRALLVRVEGKVQGVYYRAYTREQAQRLKVRGWVRNRDDGSVEAVLQGEGGALADLIGLLRAGPAHAEVSNLEVRSADAGLVSDPPADAYTF